MDELDTAVKDYCKADDGSWTISLWEKAMYLETDEWVDCWRVTVNLQDGIASPWFPGTTGMSVGATFNTYKEAWAHVNRPDLMVWALTVHALDLSQEIVHWRRRAEDVDPTNKKFRALEYLDDIRCAILDTGWPLGDDSDPELTPVRLVKEILAENAKLRECNTNQFRMLHRLNKPKIECCVPEGESAYFSIHPLQTYKPLAGNKKGGE